MHFNLPCVNFIRCPRAFRRMLTSADLSPKSDNFSGAKSNIQIKIKRIGARFMASQKIHFVLLTVILSMLHATLPKLLKLLSYM